LAWVAALSMPSFGNNAFRISATIGAAVGGHLDHIDGVLIDAVEDG
jgi:hypothetical protein